MNKKWTAEQDDTLRDLVRKGFSFTLIGERFNVSRHAAIGRAYRLGLCEKRAPRKRQPLIAKPIRRLKTVTSARTEVKAAVVRRTVAPPVELTKSQLRAMLAEAVRNTARLSA